MTSRDEPTRSAGLYMRISRDLSGESLGVTRQEEDCRAVADRLSWTVSEVYIDNDISATSGKPRPAYRKMLADLEAGAINAIIAWHPDRLYRRAVDLGELVEAVQRNRVPVATANAGDIDLNSPTGLLVAEMLAAIAMYEVRHKSERWSRSWQQKREMGAVPRTGSRLFGYTRDGEIVEHEAAIARQMAARFIDGEGIMSVARWLDSEGIRATRGSAWSNQGIKRYLTNPRLAGHSTLKGEVVGRGDWTPILDEETYQTVHAILTARTRAYAPRVALLTGLMFCGLCGYRLITSGQRNHRTYRCPSRPSMPGCGHVSGNAVPIEEMIEAATKTMLGSDEVRAAVARLQAQPSNALVELTSLDSRIRELETQLEEPDVPVETLLRAINRARGRREELENTIGARAVTTLPQVGGPWPPDLQRRRALVDLVIERIELGPGDRSRGSGRGFNTDRITITPRRDAFVDGD